MVRSKRNNMKFFISGKWFMKKLRRLVQRDEAHFRAIFESFSAAVEKEEIERFRGRSHTCPSRVYPHHQRHFAGIPKRKRQNVSESSADDAGGRATVATVVDRPARRVERILRDRQRLPHMAGSYCCSQPPRNDFPEGKGLVLIVHNDTFQPPEEPRDGSGLDRDALIANFAQVNCDCHVVENVGGDEMLRWLEKKRDEEELRKREKYAYCLVFVLSHGKGEQGIICTDKTIVHVNSIRSVFSTVLETPVVFVLNACRGGRLAVVMKEDGPGGEEEKEEEKEEGAFRFATWYSTMREFTSFRSVNEGSVFVQSLCGALSSLLPGAAGEHGRSDLKSLLHETDRRMIEAGKRGNLGEAPAADGNGEFRFVQLSDFDQGTLEGRNIFFRRKNAD